MNDTTKAAKFANSLLIFLLLSILQVLSNGCFKDSFDFSKLSTEIRLNPSFGTPLAYGSLSLRDIIKDDDSLIFYNEDHTIHLIVRKDSLISLELTEIMEIPDQDSILNNFNLHSPLISDFIINSIIPLDSLVQYMDESLAALITSLNGQNAYFPAFNASNLGEYWFDLIEDIDYVEFAEGGVFVTLTNRLPVAVELLDLEIKNDFDNSPITFLSFSDIAPDSSKTEYIALSDIMLYSLVEARVIYLDVAGSAPEHVHINLEDYLELSIVSDSIKVSRGRAIIPDQVIHERNDMITLQFSGKEDVEINDLHIKSASLNYSLQIQSEETFLVKVKLPKTTLNNSIVEFTLNTTGSGGAMNGSWDMSHTVSDFTSDSIQPFNKLPIEYTVEFFSTGEKIDFDISEHIERIIDLSLTDIVFEYVQGYFGQTMIPVNHEMFELDLDIIDKISGISVFDGANMSLFYEHSLGVPTGLFVNLDGFTASSQVTLDPPDIFIPGALFVEDTVFDTIVLDDGNSNITVFTSLRPTYYSVTGHALSNPQGPGNAPNFIHENSYFRAGVEFVVPMNLQTLDIVLVDTLEIDFSSDIFSNLDSLVIYFEAWNGFPLDATVDLTFYDKSGKTNIHTSNNLALLTAADVDDKGIVQAGQTTYSLTQINMPTEVIREINRVDHIIVSAAFNTSDQVNGPVKLLTTYSIDFKIRSDLRLSI